MEKRAFLAVVLCMAVLVVWQRFFAPPVPNQGSAGPLGTAAQQNTIGPTGGPPGGPAGGGGTATAAQGTTAAGTGLAPGGEPLPPEEAVTVDSPLYRAVVTSYGAALKSFELLDTKYYSAESWRLERRPGTDIVEPRKYDNRPTNLITTDQPALQVRFGGNDIALPPLQAWKLISNVPAPKEHTLVYEWRSDEVLLRKTLVFHRDSYQVGVTVQVRNLKTARQSHRLRIELPGYQNPTNQSQGFFSFLSRRVPQNELMWDKDGKMQSVTLEGLRSGVAPEKLHGDLRWVGIGQQYFLLAAALPHGAQIGGKQAYLEERPQGLGGLLIGAEYPERALGPDEAVSYPMTLYAGPKLPEFLDEVTVGSESAGLKTSINYTLEVLARPMLWLLRQLHALTHSWALGIVLLTLLVKLLTLYPTQRSMRSMKAMAELKPQIDALKEKCGDDKQKFNVQMMELYKRNGVNPLGGCLPMLVQMPIWYALYSMLNNAVELYRVRMLWIPDLTAADPFLVLPLCTGAMMFVQTKLSPSSADPQQKMMAVMMPIMFTGFSLFLPSGLSLYILTNTVLGIIQQTVINRSSTLKPKTT